MYRKRRGCGGAAWRLHDVQYILYFVQGIAIFVLYYVGLGIMHGLSYSVCSTLHQSSSRRRLEDYLGRYKTLGYQD
jgi:hypothetical protein